MQVIKESPSTQDILDKAKELTECSDDEELEFETWRGKNMFPPLPFDPESTGCPKKKCD